MYALWNLVQLRWLKFSKQLREQHRQLQLQLQTKQSSLVRHGCFVMVFLTMLWILILFDLITSASPNFHLLPLPPCSASNLYHVAFNSWSCSDVVNFSGSCKYMNQSGMVWLIFTFFYRYCFRFLYVASLTCFLSKFASCASFLFQVFQKSVWSSCNCSFINHLGEGWMICTLFVASSSNSHLLPFLPVLLWICYMCSAGLTSIQVALKWTA